MLQLQLYDGGKFAAPLLVLAGLATVADIMPLRGQNRILVAQSLAYFWRCAPLGLKELMLSFGADRRQIFLKLKLPAVLPYFFSALKMAVPLSVIGAAIGEWLGAQSGLGYFSKRMMTQLDGAGVFAPILLLSVSAELLVIVVGLLEKYFLRWRQTD